MSRNGWSHISRMLFSFMTCSTCLSATICPLRMHLSAYGVLVGLWSTSLTRPNVPTPRIVIILRSFMSTRGFLALSASLCRLDDSRLRMSPVSGKGSIPISRAP